MPALVQGLEWTRYELDVINGIVEVTRHATESLRTRPRGVTAVVRRVARLARTLAEIVLRNAVAADIPAKMKVDVLQSDLQAWMPGVCNTRSTTSAGVGGSAPGKRRLGAHCSTLATERTKTKCIHSTNSSIAETQ